MFIINLYRFILGYVDLSIEGDFAERILNLSSANGVKVWNIEHQNGKIKLSMFVKDFFNIRKIRGETRLKVKIIKKTGLPFLLNKYKFRFGFLIGVFVFLITLEILSSFIWSVEVVGNQTISSTQILSICDNLGIKSGANIKKIDTAKQKQRLLLEAKNLSWASINIEGCIATVNVSEIKNPATNNEPSNIVADCDGVIQEITVLNGEPLLVVGEAFQKGDILVSGTINIGEISAFVDSKAKITAKVEENLVFRKPLVITEKISTGREKTKSVLEVFWLKVPLYLGKTNGEYTYAKNSWQLSLFSQKMPIKIHSKEMEFLEEISVKYSREEIIKLLDKDFENYLTEKGISDFAVSSKEISQVDNEIVLKCVINYVKNVGIKEKILFDTFN